MTPADSSRFHRESVRHEVTGRHLRVSAVQSLSSRMRRVTLTGDELAGFTAAGPGDHVKLFFPVPGTDDTAMRDYTPLAYRPDARELDIDFVVHGDGPATAWAESAAVGDVLRIGGPRGSRLIPADPGRVVLVVDESAFPAAARWIALTPAGIPVELLAFGDPEDAAGYFAQTVPGRPVAITTTPDAEGALRAWDGDASETFFFLAGEANALVPLRRHLRRERALPAEQVQASGYWRRGTAGLDHHAPIDPDDPD
jgi:NADPH-dependent ferric siderophore reductase